MEQTIKQRLKDFIKYKGMSTRQFCLSIGASPAFVANIVKSIQPDKINNIANQYPELNTGWLLTGEGEMLKNSSDKNEETLTHRELFDQITRLTETVLSQQNIIRSQQATIEKLLEKRDSAARPDAATSANVG